MRELSLGGVMVTRGRRQGGETCGSRAAGRAGGAAPQQAWQEGECEEGKEREERRLACLGVGMLGERPAGSANGRLLAAPLPPKGLLPAAALLLEGPKGLTGVLSAQGGSGKAVRRSEGSGHGLCSGAPGAARTTCGGSRLDAPAAVTAAPEHRWQGSANLLALLLKHKSLQPAHLLGRS